MVTERFKLVQRLHDSGHPTKHPLDIAAAEWSEHALKTYKGKLLKRALKIANAMSEFVTSLIDCNPEQFDADCAGVARHEPAHD